jgi:hypothetical protein
MKPSYDAWAVLAPSQQNFQDQELSLDHHHRVSVLSLLPKRLHLHIYLCLHTVAELEGNRRRGEIVTILRFFKIGIHIVEKIRAYNM